MKTDPRAEHYMHLDNLAKKASQISIDAAYNLAINDAVLKINSTANNYSNASQSRLHDKETRQFHEAISRILYDVSYNVNRLKRPDQ